jgi:Domain of unknown function (DUF4326)/YspA, cpYpsA-related SLOG family
MASPYVVHKREPHDVYIGRPGPWGNPYVIGEDGTREQVIAKYEEHLLRSPELKGRLPELRGKTLGCWCAPQACHGDVLAYHANRRRLLVTGSRTWHDAETIWRVLETAHTFDPDILLVHGACPKGADLLCEACWDETLGGGTERVPADWYPAGQLDRASGFRRNEDMVHRGAWGCLAFIMPCVIRTCAGKKPDRGLPYHGTHGSVHCANYAEDHDIKVKRFAAPIL